MESVYKLGQRIRALRKAKDMTQEAFCRACGWNKQARISSYEVGRREPDLVDLCKMASVLDVSAAYLIGDSMAARNAAEIHLIEGFRKCNPRAQQAMLLFLDANVAMIEDDDENDGGEDVEADDGST